MPAGIPWTTPTTAWSAAFAETQVRPVVVASFYAARADDFSYVDVSISSAQNPLLGFPASLIEVQSAAQEVGVLDRRVTLSDVSLVFADDGVMRCVIENLSLMASWCQLYLGTDTLAFSDFYPIGRYRVNEIIPKRATIEIQLVDFSTDLLEQELNCAVIDEHPSDYIKTLLLSCGHGEFPDYTVNLDSFDAANYTSGANAISHFVVSREQLDTESDTDAMEQQIVEGLGEAVFSGKNSHGFRAVGPRRYKRGTGGKGSALSLIEELGTLLYSIVAPDNRGNYKFAQFDNTLGAAFSISASDTFNLEQISTYADLKNIFEFSISEIPNSAPPGAEDTSDKDSDRSTFIYRVTADFSYLNLIVDQRRTLARTYSFDSDFVASAKTRFNPLFDTDVFVDDPYNLSLPVGTESVIVYCQANRLGFCGTSQVHQTSDKYTVPASQVDAQSRTLDPGSPYTCTTARPVYLAFVNSEMPNYVTPANAWHADQLGAETEIVEIDDMDVYGWAQVAEWRDDVRALTPTIYHTNQLHRRIICSTVLWWLSGATVNPHFAWDSVVDVTIPRYYFAKLISRLSTAPITLDTELPVHFIPYGLGAFGAVTHARPIADGFTGLTAEKFEIIRKELVFSRSETPACHLLCRLARVGSEAVTTTETVTRTSSGTRYQNIIDVDDELISDDAGELLVT